MMAATSKVIRMDEHRAEGPQLEDGYVRIANELMDAIMLKLSSYRHIKVVLAILRKTYGYGKKEDDVSLSQIAEITGLHRPHVSVAIRELAEMGVLNPVRHGVYGQILGLNKHHHQWKTGATKTVGVTKTVTPAAVTETVRTCYQNSNEGVTETVQNHYQNSNHKRQPQKTTPKDNSKRQSAQDAPEVSDAFAEAWASYPKREGGNSKAAAMKAWQARVNAGVSEADMLAGVRRYAAFCDAKGKTGTEYVKQAATFFGPSAAWAEEWEVQAQAKGPERNPKTGAVKVGGVWVL